MTTRGMQYIIDNASAIEFSRAKTVGQLVVRSGRMKTAERASTVPWQMIVTPPTYSRYEDVRDLIEGITVIDRNTEFFFRVSNTAGMSYITAYRGDLNDAQTQALRVSTGTGFVGTATWDISGIVNYNTSTGVQRTFDYIRITGLPSIGDQISGSLSTKVAIAPTTTTNAFNAGSNIFYLSDPNYHSMVVPGNVVNAPGVITTGTTITNVTNNFVYNGEVTVTKVEMSANAISTATGPVNVQFSNYTYVTSATTVFRAGDWIQFRNSQSPWGQYSTYVTDTGLPRTIPLDVPRGTGTYVDVPLHRPLVFTGTATYAVNGRAGADVFIGPEVYMRMYMSKMPSYKLLPGKLVQWTGDFELYEYIEG